MKLKLKKLTLYVLVLALVLSGTFMVAMAAGDGPTVTLSSGSVRAGESVTLTVSIEDNPGLAAFMLYLNYNTSVFSVDEDEGVVAKGKFASGGSVVCNNSGSGITILWFNGSGKNVTADGNVLTVTLNVASGAVNGTYPIELCYSPDNTANSDEEFVALNTVSGTLTVSGGVSGTVVPEKEEEEASLFSDVEGHWAETEILKAAELGLINGYPNGTYGPDKTMTRAECVTILWRAAGAPEPKGEASFTDLTQDWYRKAVAWAEENSVVNGVGDGRFAPNGYVTREQLVTILHRLAGTPSGMELMMTSIYDASYTDSDSVHAWAKHAVYWSVYKEIYCGEDSLKVGAELKPTAYANRAQIAVMMVRYLDKY